MIAPATPATLLLTYEPAPKQKKPKKPKMPSALGSAKKARALQRSGFECVYCGKDLLGSLDELLSATVDHLLPHHAGGDNGDENLFACCFVCNHLKGGRKVASVHEGRNVIATKRAVLGACYADELVRLGRIPDKRDALPVKAASTKQAVDILARQAKELAESLRIVQKILTVKAPSRRPWWRQVARRAWLGVRRFPR